uniref:Secreted protein n=1 Tax=Syphacia muris TaxID=451379 RepID=A0A0N5AQ62_9BILA
MFFLHLFIINYATYLHHVFYYLQLLVKQGAWSNSRNCSASSRSVRGAFNFLRGLEPASSTIYLERSARRCTSRWRMILEESHKQWTEAIVLPQWTAEDEIQVHDPTDLNEAGKEKKQP